RAELARRAPAADLAAMAHAEPAAPGRGGDAVLQLLPADLGRSRACHESTRRAPGRGVLHDRDRGDRAIAPQAHRPDGVCGPCAGVTGRAHRARDALAVGTVARGGAVPITPEPGA